MPIQKPSKFGGLQLNTWRRTLGVLKKAAPGLTAISAVLVVADVVATFGVFYGIRLLADGLAAAGGAGLEAETTRSVLWVLAGTAFLIAISVSLTVLNTYVRSRQGIQVGEFVDGLVHRKATSVDYAFYESPDYFDTLQRARQSGAQRPAQIISRALLAAKSALFLFGAIIVIGAIEWRIVPAIISVVAIILFIRLKYTRSLFEWVLHRTQLERRAAYHDHLMTSQFAAKEIRIGRLGDRFRQRYVELRKEINETQLVILWRQSGAELWTAALGATVFAGAIGFLVLETAAGRQSVGDLVFFVLVFRRAESSGREFVAKVAQLYDDQLFLTQLFSFLDVRPRVVPPEHPLPVPTSVRDGLRLQNVSFRYPGSEKQALRNVDLALPAGQIVGLVGENGSGKTSIIKLLLRFYEPDTGKITLDGVEISEFDPCDYRGLFSTVFQDFACYAATVSENISFGSSEPEPDVGRLAKSANQSGASDFIQLMRKGYDTPLTRVFDDGVEISTGQWQRIAIARGLYPKSQVVILDEPTSAIDAQAEAQMFHEFRAALGGRSALLISHRLTSLQHADYLYVVSDGRVIEEGEFRDLVNDQTAFRSLFAAQFTDGMGGR
jgi:ATP-binding cassette subfamily B protein